MMHTYKMMDEFSGERQEVKAIGSMWLLFKHLELLFWVINSQMLILLKMSK